MAIWIDFLKDCLNSEKLDNYSNIYYIGSCSNFNKTNLEEAITKNELYTFITNCKPNVNYDIFHFYIAMNGDNNDLIIVYDPFELFESSSLYKIVVNFKGNLLIVPTVERIK